MALFLQLGERQPDKSKGGNSGGVLTLEAQRIGIGDTLSGGLHNLMIERSP
jgi:hypothetical protein